MSSHQYPLHYPSDPHGTAQKTQVPMRRTSSYRTGDDMTFFDDSTDGSNGPGGGYSGNAGHTTHSTHVNNLGSRHSQFSVGSSQYSAVSQVSSHGSSALSGYHHQHQPPPSSAVQQPYNPQHFVQPSPPTQAQSGYNAPYTPSSPYAGQSFQTYNPAAYQSSTPTTSYQATANAPWHSGTPVQSYASSPQFSYQDPQSSVPNRPYEGYNDYPYDDSARPSLGYTPNTPQHTVNSPLLTQSPAHPNLPPPPPPPQGNSPGSYGTDVANEHHGRNSYSNRYTNISQTQYPYPSSPPPHGTGVQQLSPQHYNSGETYFTGIPTATSQSPHENIAPPPPLHQTSSMPPRRADTLTRHPQSRPLPGPPSGSNNIPTPSHDGDGYDEILKEIEAAVMEGRPVSTRRHSSRTSRARPTQPPIPESDDNSVSGMQTQTNGGSRDNTNTDDCSDDSDTVAAAGLAALKMAEEEEAAIIARRNTHTSTSSSYGYQPPESTPSHSAPPQTESNSDSDFVIQDVGFYGGYNAPMHYGTDQTIPHAHDRVAATSGSIRSSNRSTDDRATTADEFDYPGFDHDSIHPFPQFTPTARVDNVGTGGLSEPSFQERRRLSFDNGDETIRSRQSQSSSIAETPEEDGELPDLFFHPGMSSRPLPPPPIPSGAQNLIPGLMPAGTYRSNEQSDGGYEQYYQLSNPASPDGFQPHPNSSAVPRSTSLSDHTTTHRADPIIRSKTDAERTKTKQSNYESAISTPSVTLDLPVLPAGKRKKFNPAKLSTEQFKKCKEPWGLSSIVSWVKDLAEEEADLKEQSIVNAIVALFTHKVPTMNTADAETLGAIVVQNMFSAGVLIEDEEWVKFGTGSLSGVLWQITGQGCYSSRLHVGEFDGFGRCYSHHCMRTLKKINLQTQVMEPQKKAEDWATFYKIGKEVFDTHSRKEIDRQNNLHEIVTTEDSFIGQLDVLRSLYRDQLHSMQPSVISPKKLDRFLRDVFGKVDEVKKVNEEFLLAQLKYCQREQGPFILGFSHIFREWIRKAKAAYIDYAATFPYANYLVRREAQTNILFRQFLKQARENKLSNRLSWDTYLKAPITRIQRYTLLLSTVHKNMEKDSEEKLNLQHAIEEIKLVALECDNKVGEMTKKVDLKELGSKLQLRPEMKRVVELNLEHLGREIIHQGDLQRPRTKRFNWVDVRAILFDHYLVLSKIVPTRDTTKPETYDVSKLPIPMDLLVLVSTNDDPVIKSTVKGISSIAPVNTRPAAPGTLSHVGTNNSTSTTGSAMSGKTITTTVLESSRDDKVLYPFRIKHLGEDTYFLYASTAQCRQEWCEKIIEAKTKHAASLYAQNAEPFRLRVLSDSAFAYPDQAVMPKCAVIRGTPLDRAIREVEKKYEGNLSRPLPICRASVNCATVFSQPQGRMMCAVGTDYGVFISAYDDPRGWSKVSRTNLPNISLHFPVLCIYWCLTGIFLL